MISTEMRYLNTNRILMQVIAVWPYKRSRFNQLHSMFLQGILLTFIMSLFATLLTSVTITIDLIIRVLSSSLVFLLTLVKYNWFYNNFENVKYALDQLQLIYKELKDKNEIAIIEKYGKKGERYALVFSTLTLSGLSILILLPLWSQILNVIHPLNQSRPYHPILLLTEHFIDREKYIYLIVLHTNAAILIGLVTTLATGTILLTYLEYVCGTFRIVSYRLERAMRKDILRNIDLKNEIQIYKGIVHAIDMHRKAMKYCDFVTIDLSTLLLILIIIGVIAITVNLYRVYRLMIAETIDKFILLPIGSILIQNIYMFMSNFISQEIIDHNNDVFKTVYNIQWYKVPLHIQKIILFLLQKSTRTFSFVIAGLFIPSLEGYVTMQSAVLSYFTFMYSTRP